MYCATSFQRFNDDNGDDLAEPISRGTTDVDCKKTLLSPSSLATSLSQLPIADRESYFSIFMSRENL